MVSATNEAYPGDNGRTCNIGSARVPKKSKARHPQSSHPRPSNTNFLVHMRIHTSSVAIVKHTLCVRTPYGCRVYGLTRLGLTPGGGSIVGWSQINLGQLFESRLIVNRLSRRLARINDIRLRRMDE